MKLNFKMTGFFFCLYLALVSGNIFWFNNGNVMECAEIMSSQKFAPNHTNIRQSINLEFITDLKTDAMEKPEFESTRAADDKSGGAQKNPPGDVIEDVGDSEDETIKEPSVKVKNFYTLLPEFVPSFLKEKPDNEDSTENDRTLTEEDDDSNLSPEKEKSVESPEAQDIEWDPKYGNYSGVSQCVATVSSYRGDVAVTPKNTSTPGVLITTHGPLQLTITRDQGSPFKKQEEKGGDQSNASTRLLRTRSKKTGDKPWWLKEVIIKILTLTKTVKTRDNRVEVINKFGTNGEQSFKWLCDAGFIDMSVEMARLLKISDHTEFKTNKDTFLHLALIGEKYEVLQDEVTEIEALSSGDSDRAKHYRWMLNQMIGRMMASGMMPGLEDSEAVGDILIGMKCYWPQFASSFFYVIARCLQTQAIQRKYLLKLKKTIKDMHVKVEEYEDLIGKVECLDDAEEMKSMVKKECDVWINLIHKITVELLDGWRDKVKDDNAVVELGGMFSFWIVDPGVQFGTLVDPILDNSSGTIIFVATSTEDVDKFVESWTEKLIEMHGRAVTLVSTYTSRAANETAMRSPENNFSPIPAHENQQLDYFTICREVGGLDIGNGGDKNDLHVVYDNVNISTEKQQASSEPTLRDRAHDKLINAVSQTVVKWAGASGQEGHDKDIDLRPAYLKQQDSQSSSSRMSRPHVTNNNGAAAAPGGGPDANSGGVPGGPPGNGGHPGHGPGHRGGPPGGNGVPPGGGGHPGGGPGHGGGPGRGEPGPGPPGRGDGPPGGGGHPGGGPGHGDGPGRSEPGRGPPGRGDRPPGGSGDPHGSDSNDKERNLAARIQAKIRSTNEMISDIPSKAELDNIKDRSALISCIALVQACQESIKSISNIQNKLDELGATPPDVTWNDESVSSEAWIARANVEMSLKKQIAEAAKKSTETTEKIVSDEILKKIGTGKLPVLDANWKAVTFLQKLAGLFDNEEVRRAAESSPGYADYIRSFLRGKDLEKTRHLVWGHEVTSALKETYCSTGYGVELAFEDHIYLLKAPVQSQGRGHRHQTMQTNMNATYVQLVAIYDLEVQQYVNETNLAVAIAVCTDNEYAGKWEALLLKFNRADDIERESILNNPYLDLNDSALGAPASSRSGSGNTSVLQRRPLVRGWDKPSTRIDMTCNRAQQSTIEEQFRLMLLFLENASSTLEGVRIKELKTNNALKRAYQASGQTFPGNKPWLGNNGNKPWFNNSKPGTSGSGGSNHINNLNDHTLDGSDNKNEDTEGSVNNVGGASKTKKRKLAPCKMLCQNSSGWGGYRCQEGLPGPGSCYFCETMLGATPKKRGSLVTSVVLCGRCLQNGDPATGGHLQADCRSNHRCRECGGDHNTLLHEVWGDPGNKTGTNATNNIDVDDEDDTPMDGSGFTEDLIDSINNIGEDGEQAYDTGWINSINADPKAMAIFKSLVAKVKPKSNKLEYDDWSQEKKDEYKLAYESLKKSVTAAKREAAARTGAQCGDVGSINNISDPTSLDVYNDFMKTAKLLDLAQERALKVNQDGKEENSQCPSFSRIRELAVRGKTFSKASIQRICRENAHIISHLNDNKSCNYYEPKLTEGHDKTQNLLMKAETMIHRLSSKTFLNFVPVDVLVDNPTPETITALESIPDVSIGYRQDRCYARCLCLHDPGSTLNVTTIRFGTAIGARAVVRGEMPLKTVAGRACPNNMYLLRLQAGSFLHNLAVVMLEQFSPATGFSCLDVGLLEMLLGLGTTLGQNVNLPEKTKDCHILLGNGDSDLNIVRIWDPRSVGLKPLLFSRDIQLYYCRFSVDKKVIISGRFGTAKYICDKAQENDNFPRFLIPAEHEEDVDTRLEKMIKMMENPQKILDASTLVTNRLRAMNDLHIDADTVRSWSTINNIAATLAEEGDYTIETGLAPNNMFNVNNISPGGTKALLDYLAGEAVLLNPQILCKNHKNLANQLMKECPNCAPLNTSLDEMTQKMRYLELWDKVNLEKEEDGSSKIVVTVPFSQPLETIGRLKNMNLKQAEQATRRLMDKADEMDSLDIIHGQIRDKMFVKHLSIIPQEDIVKIEKGLIFAQTVLRNKVYNLSSASSPLRLVCNTASNIPFSNSSLTKADTCPKYDLVSLLNMGIRAILSPVFCSLDLKGAYLSLHTCPKTRFMYITVWLMDPKSRTGVVLLASERIDFGFSSASILLRIALVKLGIPLLDLDLSKSTIRDSCYVDNLNVDKAKSPTELANCIVDLKVNLGKIKLVIDKLYLPRWIWDMDEMKPVRDLYNDDFKPVTNSLGLVWDLHRDEFVPNTNLTIFDNYRGMPGGPSLKDTDLDKDEMTRDGLCRVVPQIWDQIGKYHGPNMATAKLLLSQVCKVVPMTALKEPIRVYSEELGEMCKTFFKRLANTEMMPTPRVCLKVGYRITTIYVDHDASHLAVAAVILVLSENEQGDQDCHLIMAKSVISNNTVISNEVRSHACGAMLLVTFITAIKPLIDTHNYEFEIICVTDNAPSSYIFKNDNKGVLNRNTRNIVLRSLVTIQDMVPDTKVTMSWIPSALMTAEYCTKIYMNAPDICNNPRWRHGHPMLKSPHLIKHFWFVKCENEIIMYRDLPVLDVKDDFKATVEANPIKDEDSHIIIFDKNDNKLEETFPVDQEVINNITGEADSNRDKAISIDDFISIVLDSEETFDPTDHMTFLSMCELEEHAGMHDDQENAAEVYKYSHVYHITSEEDVKVTEGDMSLPGQDTVFTQAEFEFGYMDMEVTNVLVGETAPEPMAKDVYDRVMEVSNDVIKIINFILNVKSWFTSTQQPIVDRTPKSIWSLLIASDQAHYGISKDKAHLSEQENGFTIVPLTLDGVSLPYLDNKGPLLHKIIMTHHKERTGQGWMEVTHVGLSKLRAKLNNSQYGVWCFSVDREIKKVLDTCGHCLRSQLKKFKIKSGTRYVMTDPQAELFFEASGDPVGPIVCKQWKSARRSTLMVYLLLLVCHHSAACVIQVLGDLQAESVILGLLTIERRLNVSLKHLYFDKGSSLTPKLLQSPSRQWVIHQHAATAHHRLFAERKIADFRRIYNKIMKKFSHENKAAIPLNIFQLLFLASNIQLTINSVPYSKHSKMSPAMLLHARGLVNEFVHSMEELDIPGTHSMEAVDNWIERMREFRYELLADVINRPDVVGKTSADLYIPFWGDVVLARLGDGSIGESNVVTVSVHNKQTHRHPDAPKVSTRSVIIANQRGYERLFPTEHLSLLVEGNGRKTQKETESHNHDFSTIPGKFFRNVFNSTYLALLQIPNNDCKTKNIQLCSVYCSMSSLSLYFSVHSTLMSRCQSTTRLCWDRLCSMGALFSSWGAGQVKVEAAFSSDKYLHPEKDGAGVYYDWSVMHVIYHFFTNIAETSSSRNTFACTYYTLMIFRVNGIYEPSMRALESVTNHLGQATSDSFTFTAVGLGVTWGVIVVLVALRYVYGCRLAKEHRDPEPGHHPKMSGVHYRQYPTHQVEMIPSSCGQDPMVINTRRTSVAEAPPGIKIKVETDN